MNEREFVYWLQGFLEVADPTKINERQVQVIKDHLALVLNKVTPVIKISEPKMTEERRKQIEFELSRPRVLCSKVEELQPMITWDKTVASC